MATPLSDEMLQQLLTKEAKQLNPHTRIIPPQIGPIRWFDKEMRCASRGCSSPTYVKVGGVPLCYSHSLTKANDMLVNLGVTV